MRPKHSATELRRLLLDNFERAKDLEARVAKVELVFGKLAGTLDLLQRIITQEMTQLQSELALARKHRDEAMAEIHRNREAWIAIINALVPISGPRLIEVLQAVAHQQTNERLVPKPGAKQP